MASQQPSKGPDGKVVAGAATVGLVAGAVLSGPIVALAAAGGAAYAATRQDKVGEVAKSTGQAAVAVGSKASDLDKQHNITGKVAEGARTTFNAAKDFDQKHDVSGKIGSGITSLMNGITSALQPKGSGAPPPPPPPPDHRGVFPPR
jgi:hypothetical protein